MKLQLCYFICISGSVICLPVAKVLFGNEFFLFLVLMCLNYGVFIVSNWMCRKRIQMNNIIMPLEYDRTVSCAIFLDLSKQLFLCSVFGIEKPCWNQGISALLCRSMCVRLLPFHYVDTKCSKYCNVMHTTLCNFGVIFLMMRVIHV